MGQKVHPRGFRLKVTEEWREIWFAKNKRIYAEILASHLDARAYLYKELAQAAVSDIRIERLEKNARIIVLSGRPGVILGKKGDYVTRLSKKVAKILKVPVHIKIEEVRKPELHAKLVAEGVAQQLEKRIMFRRAMKRAITSAMRAGAKGIKIKVSGRLNGAEIARSENYLEGRMPLHTLRANIDYSVAEAHTTYGVIGVKVWIFKGEVLPVRGQGIEEVVEG